MKPSRAGRQRLRVALQAMCLAWVASGPGASAALAQAAAPPLALWDTGVPFGETIYLDDRSRWQRVPANLLGREADPAKAFSDPAYYGRPFAFKGDAVVENRHLTAVFWSRQGRMVLYARSATASPPGGSSPALAPARQFLEFVPGRTDSGPMGIGHCDILRNTDNDVALKISFVNRGLGEVSATFAFDNSEIVDVQPAATMREVQLRSAIAYAVLPEFIGDDLVYDPAAYPGANALELPAESLFLGLLKGEDGMLVMTWPKGNQRLRLGLAPASGGRRVDAIDFDDDGRAFYLAALAAPGIWHQEELNPSFLERDVAIHWKRPFPAKWKTQLSEAGVKTTFKFRAAKGQVWRGVPGFYRYPVWFEGDTAFYHLSKKVPPLGRSLIYFVEGENTPVSITTPADILKATLGRSPADAILDFSGRQLRTHHRRGAVGVRRACTCGCTEALQHVFETGQEAQRQAYVEGAVDDMLYFVRSHVARIGQYRRFADGLIRLLQSKAGAAPELKEYLDRMEAIAREIPREYAVQKPNMRSLSYADDLARQTIALAGTKDPKHLPAYLELGKAWRAMGGAQDYVLADCHAITRKLMQAAGYDCVIQPQAVPVAEEIRSRCRRCLRNPDGYEIWPDY